MGQVSLGAHRQPFGNRSAIHPDVIVVSARGNSAKLTLI